jgi:protein subunit release factor A
MDTRENVSKTYIVRDVNHGTVVQGDYIINNSPAIITPSPNDSNMDAAIQDGLETIESTNDRITNKKADVLLVTATKVESKAILDVFQKTTGHEAHLMSMGNQMYHDIGSINGKSVVLVQSEMGSGGI